MLVSVCQTRSTPVISHPQRSGYGQTAQTGPVCDFALKLYTPPQPEPTNLRSPRARPAGPGPHRQGRILCQALRKHSIIARMHTPDTAQFQPLADGLGAGLPPDGWAAIAELPLLILVGVTGVGKSTTVQAVAQEVGQISLLPNRRTLADLLVIPAVQAWDGDPPTPVTDRRLRFEYTGRYRQRHPGGLAHALTRLVLQQQPNAWPGLLIFDGLRGAQEAAFAAEALPLARFAVLHAPDGVRVERLLQRRDEFDRIAFDRAGGLAPAGSFRWEDAPEAAGLFHPAEQERLAGLVAQGQVDADELAAKIAIVAAERRNYDPDAATKTLQRQASSRTVVIDTTSQSPAQAAQAIRQALGADQ